MSTDCIDAYAHESEEANDNAHCIPLVRCSESPDRIVTVKQLIAICLELTNDIVTLSSIVATMRLESKLPFSFVVPDVIRDVPVPAVAVYQL